MKKKTFYFIVKEIYDNDSYWNDGVEYWDVVLLQDPAHWRTDNAVSPGEPFMGNPVTISETADHIKSLGISIGDKVKADFNLNGNAWIYVPGSLKK